MEETYENDAFEVAEAEDAPTSPTTGMGEPDPALSVNGGSAFGQPGSQLADDGVSDGGRAFGDDQDLSEFDVPELADDGVSGRR